ncbi:MAG: hypothetical protein H6744_02735 [Deltaproteobacteria bacterium]|nr:hypothetical protein [Deltaproteobacteria bacterium]
MTEIICISCWSSFEVETPSASGAQVTCPLCGFVQAGPISKPMAVPAGPADAGLHPGAPTDSRQTATPPDPGPVRGRGAAPPPLPPPVPLDRERDPFAQMGPELGFDIALDAAGADGREVSPVSAVLAQLDGGPDELSPELAAGLIAPEADSAEPPPARWKLRTGSGLLLHFPSYETAVIWAAGHDGPLGITCGELGYRRYKAFHHATKSIADPIEALMATPSFEERPDLGAALPPEPLAPAHLTARVHDKPSVDEILAPHRDAASKPAAGAAAGAAAPPARSHRARSQDFSFRTGAAVSIWPSRVIFLTLGIILGAGVVYYLAWLGIMPGVQY